MLKKIYAKLKMVFDTWKMWLFVAALFGTNGAQMYVNSEPVEPVPVKSALVEPKKTIIIHKVDNGYCDRKLNEHKKGAQH